MKSWQAALGKQKDDSEWLSVSDLMAGLMMVFLIIAIAMIRSVMIEREKIRAIAESYHQSQLAIYQSLQQVFGADLDAWAPVSTAIP